MYGIRMTEYVTPTKTRVVNYGVAMNKRDAKEWADQLNLNAVKMSVNNPGQPTTRYSVYDMEGRI